MLGFWWLVIELRHREFITDPRLRAASYQVSLYFALPGMMSLTSLLAAENTVLWRIGFVAAGVFGLIQAPRALRSLQWMGSTRTRFLQAAMTFLYALLVVVALWPSLPEQLGLGLTALEAAGLLVALFIFLGINLAWVHFMNPAPSSDGDADLPPGGLPL